MNYEHKGTVKFLEWLSAPIFYIMSGLAPLEGEKGEQ